MNKLTAERRKELLDEIEYNRKHCFLSSKTELLMQVAQAALTAKPVNQFIVNDPAHDGYIEWADCNPDYFSREPSDRRRILYTAPPVPVLKPIELNKGALMISAYATDPMNEDPVLCLSKDGVIAAIRAAGYEVTE